MNKKVAISMGLKIDQHNQLDYFIDTRWFDLAGYLNLDLAPISEFNWPDENIKYILLTGGNTIGDMPRRDNFERKIIDYVVKSNNKIKLLGICRGCQLINQYFGGSNKKIKNHVNKLHRLKKRGIEVTCYHNYSPSILGKNLVAADYAEDGNIEEIKNVFHKINGIMWHPERENLKKIANHFSELLE